MKATCTIRAQASADADAVRALLIAAFGGQAEADLVEALLAADRARIARVAADGDEVIGHVLFTPMRLDDGPMTDAVLGLAPLAVAPAWQGRGVGTALTRAGLDACRQRGARAVCVLGEPAYYQRFGFLPASRWGVDNTFGVDEPFMLLELVEGGWPRGVKLARYAPEFGEDLA